MYSVTSICCRLRDYKQFFCVKKLQNIDFCLKDKKSASNLHFSFQCKIYFATNTTSCRIPCDLSGCTYITRRYTNCPVWICEEKTTTVPTTTTSATTTSVASTTSFDTTTFAPTTTPFDPKPDPNPQPSNLSLDFSIVFNAILGLALLIFLAYCFRRKLLNILPNRLARMMVSDQNRSARENFSNPLPSTSGFRPSEQIPLINVNPAILNEMDHVSLSESSPHSEQGTGNFFTRCFRK